MSRFSVFQLECVQHLDGLFCTHFQILNFSGVNFETTGDEKKKRVINGVAYLQAPVDVMILVCVPVNTELPCENVPDALRAATLQYASSLSLHTFCCCV